jgi:hypothetical protein
VKGFGDGFGPGQVEPAGSQPGGDRGEAVQVEGEGQPVGGGRAGQA